MGEASLGEDALKASVATTFEVLAWEMELAAARCIHLDAVVGKLLKRMGEEGRAEFGDSAHVVDLLAQQLTNLSAFTRRMSGSVAPDAIAEVDGALGDITLGALADRMCVALGGTGKTTDDRDGAGDVDLF